MSLIIHADCLPRLKLMDTDSVDLVFGSPPYAGKSKRYPDTKTQFPNSVSEWVEEMVNITLEACRVSRGYVIWVVDSYTRKGQYLPAVENLICQASSEPDIITKRPVIWHKNSPPSGGDEWFKNSYEYVIGFHASRVKPHFDWESIGTPPKYKAGGKFRQRTANGKRKIGNDYPTNPITRPKNVIHCLVGGGHMATTQEGNKIACSGEAPFPESLATIFVKSCCPKKGIVLDPFGGSGTTGAVAIELNRKFILIENRKSQIKLCRSRIAEAKNRS